MTYIPDKITNPVGLDAVIQECQTYMESNLTEVEIIFGKAYKNFNKEDESIPEVYYKDNEYYEVLTDDRYKSIAFFDVRGDVELERGNTDDYIKTRNIRFIVFGNLDKIYTSFTHRADENLKLDVESAFKSFRPSLAKWELINIVETSEKVLDNYSYNLSEKLNNMQPYIILGFDFQVTYDNEINC